MWPFSIFQRRKRKRTFKAAALVFLGTYFYDGLSAQEKARVEADVADRLIGFDPEIQSWYANSWEAAGAFRSVAMAHLEIGPMAGLSWPELLKPWKNCTQEGAFGLPDRDGKPSAIFADYHPMDQATEDARTFLQSEGLDIPEVGPWSLPNVDGGKPLGPGEHARWRKNAGKPPCD